MAKKQTRKRVKLIYNPGAGDHPDSNARLEQAVRCLADHGMQVDVALAKPRAVATPIARQAAKAGYKLVIAMGGDGTIEAVAKGLIGTKTRLGIIPSGTVNNIAKFFNLPLEFDSACTLIEKGHERQIDVGQIKIKGKKRKEYFFEAAGVGLVGSLYPVSKDIRKGQWQQVIESVKTLINFQTPKIYLTLDDESKIKVESLLVTVANGPAYGMTFLVAPNASMEDGYFDVCAYPGFSKTDLIGYFSAVAEGGQNDDKRVLRYRARKVKIKCNPKLDAIADAELLGRGDFTIRMLPKAVRVITGQHIGLAKEAATEEQDFPALISPTEAPPVAPPEVVGGLVEQKDQVDLAKKLIVPVAAGIVGAGLLAINKLHEKDNNVQDK